MKKYKHDLKAMAQCSPARVRRMIRKGDDDFILAILDAVWTTLDGRVELFEEQLTKIRSVQSVSRSLKQSLKQSQGTERQKPKICPNFIFGFSNRAANRSGFRFYFMKN